MSGIRRGRHRRQRHATHAERWTGTVAGWCADDPHFIDQAKRQTHDSLIEMMGPKRAGGVTWYLQRDDEALTTIGRMIVDSTNEPEFLEGYVRIRDLLTEQGGVLVVAAAPAYR